LNKNIPDAALVPERPERRDQIAQLRERIREAVTTPTILEWQPQERPFEDPESCCWFDFEHGGKAVVATPAAMAKFGPHVLGVVLAQLHREAQKYAGLDYLQVYVDQHGNKLWVIEDGETITALLPSDY